jgi:molybdopterin synthase sulfur carrier subunit
MPASPAVTIQLPRILRSNGAGVAELAVTATNVGAALKELEQQDPVLYRGVCDETGCVRKHINLFVNSAHISLRDGLETVLASGDVVTIMPSVSGG